MAQGTKTGGRKQGTPNKLTRDVKQAIEYVAEGLGGAEGMLQWAQEDTENTRVFWSQIYPKLLPKEIKAGFNGVEGESHGVLVVPATMTMEEWLAAYKASTASADTSDLKHGEAVSDS